MFLPCVLRIRQASDVFRTLRHRVRQPSLVTGHGRHILLQDTKRLQILIPGNIKSKAIKIVEKMITDPVNGSNLKNNTLLYLQEKSE